MKLKLTAVILVTFSLLVFGKLLYLKYKYENPLESGDYVAVITGVHKGCAGLILGQVTTCSEIAGCIVSDKYQVNLVSCRHGSVPLIPVEISKYDLVYE